jgi:hypothetical protein
MYKRLLPIAASGLPVTVNTRTTVAWRSAPGVHRTFARHVLIFSAVLALSPDFSPRLDALWGLPEGGASAPPKSRLPPSVGPVPRAACGRSPQRPRGTGHRNNQGGLVTSGLEPRPSRPVARNAG